MPASDEIVEFGPYRLHVAGRLLQRNGVVVEIGSRALDLLIALVERPGEVLTRRELIARAWPGLVVDDANLRVNVASLRKCLGERTGGARYIVNVPGRGYSFVGPTKRVRSDSSSQKSSPRLQQPPPGAASTAHEHSLPEKLGRLVGRDDSIVELDELLTKHRFVSIVGPGGMGKTTVAIFVAHRMLDAFDGAVYFVDLGSLTDASLIPGTIAGVLGLKVPSQDPRPSILAFLASRRTLLVLDNCEHLIDKAADLAEWLYRSAPQTHLLATSRESLRVEGEHVHILPPLEAPPPVEALTAADAMSFPAVQLFMDRVAATGAGEQLTNEIAALAGEICRRMDGIALAIELAAGRVRSHGVRGTAELLHHRFNLLWQGRRSALPRHQTLQAMLDWSYNLLSDTDRRVLYRLSVFVGPFDLSAAQRIAADAALDEAAVTEAIESLIDKSLLSSSMLNGVSYLRLLDTTRAYASAKLVDSGEFPTVSRRLAEYLIARLGDSERGRKPSDADRAFVQVGSVRAALDWAFADAGDSALGVRLAALCAPRFLERSLLEDCFHWCELALLRLGAKAGSTTHLILQEALAISAMFTRGNGNDVRESIEHGLRLARSLGDQQRELSLLAGLHIFMTRIGDFTGAVEVGRRSIELARRMDSSAGIVMAEWMVGCAFHLIGDQAGALRHSEEAFKQAAARGVTKIDLFGYGHRTRALIVLARTLWMTGSVDRAAQVARQSVEEAEQGEHPVNKCIAQIYSATVFLWRGDVDEADALVSRLIQHASRYSLRPYQAVGIALSGEVALLKGDCRAAVDRLREALGILHAERHHVITTALSRSMAEALLHCDEIVEAEAMITAALERAEAQNGAFDMPELLRTRAEIGTASGRLDARAAEAMCRRSLELASSQSALSLELRAAMALGKLLAQQGRVQEAYSTLQAIYDRFTEGQLTRDLKMARELIEAWSSLTEARS
ncbi:winged helix-turn-helix domain-containing protein [Steroidobacter sp. S1-65]|uniref:Winged helix-turn-helix domain-containing protein n=1 Tax=Steroidobacter gossypii TaxID=2805490 RepID=A0ABS1X1E8_9GAMM|nr:winged helix-turn-helix domain-containing protein [Steroidobacter gossypii]MBM0107063.1 winged helix-turn-helix domain-containing protein [Steroidobacter gossypii]